LQLSDDSDGDIIEIFDEKDNLNNRTTGVKSRRLFADISLEKD